VVSYYQVADIFLNASTTETQGLTYLESLAIGTPILVKRDDCLIDILKDGVNGFYFDTLDELSLYMKKLVNKEIDISTLKNKTYDTIKHYSKEKFAENILKVYEDAIKKQNDVKPKFFTKSY
ncbi:glycosyltransferase, partial [gut metagenome]